MSVTGDIVEVRVQSRGSQLVGDHTSGASSIVVADPTDFDTAGGMLRIDGTVYTWTSVTLNGTDDEATATLAITPNLAANEPDTMPVELWSGAQVIDDVVLTVDAGGDTPAYVSLRSDQRKDWTAREGYLEPAVPATFSDDFSVLLDADGYTPYVDLSTASGILPDEILAQIPTNASDGIVPAATPDPQVYSAIGGLAIRLPAVTNADQVIVDVWISTTNPPSTSGTPNGSILMPPGAPSLFPARDIGGVKLTAGTTYYVRTQARDADGNGPLSNVVSGTPAVATGNDVVVTAGMLVANDALINALTVVDLSTVTLTAVTLDSGHITGGDIAIAVTNSATYTETFGTGTTMPTGWKVTTKGLWNYNTGDPNGPTAAVSSTGPTGQVGSALKVDYRGGLTVSDDSYGWVQLGSDAGAALDFDLYFRFQNAGSTAVSGEVEPGLSIAMRHNDEWQPGGSPLFGGDSSSRDNQVRLVGLFVGSSLFTYAGYANGSAISTTTIAIPTITLNEWWNVRMKVRGATFQTRVWKDGNTEPTTWDTRTLQVPLGAGRLEFSWVRSSSAVFPPSRVTYVDRVEFSRVAGGLRVPADGGGDWPVVLDPMRSSILALSGRVGALEAATSSSITATSPFTSTASIQKVGKLGVLQGGFGRASSFSTTFTKCGTIADASYRPAVDVTLPAAALFNSTVTYQIQILATGDVNIRQSAATTGNMSGTGGVFRLVG